MFVALNYGTEPPNEGRHLNYDEFWVIFQIGNVFKNSLGMDYVMTL
jgi:hypothetical protein